MNLYNQLDVLMFDYIYICVCVSLRQHSTPVIQSAFIDVNGFKFSNAEPDTYSIGQLQH